MKAYQIAYSEGDPVVVVADDFNHAVDSFTTWVRREDGYENAYEADVRSWTEAVNGVADEVIFPDDLELDPAPAPREEATR